MPELALSCFGTFTAALDEQPITSFRTRTVQALLIYLACEGDRPHLRDSLLGLLWPGLPQRSAQKNLRQSLYLLRQVIPAVDARDGEGAVPLLLADRRTLQLNPEAAVSLDVDAFTSLLSGSQSDWPEAVSLYRGDFLAEFYLPDSAAFESWVAVRRGELRRRALKALAALTDSRLEAGILDDADQYARRQLEIDGLRESAHRQLMTVLARNGRRRAALSHYETCCRLLHTELGIEPSAKTVALYEAICAGELSGDVAIIGRPEQLIGREPSGLPLSHVEPVRHNLPAQTTPFVGREIELTELDDLIADPGARLVTIVGPGGMGKTRLALAAVERLLLVTGGHETRPYADGLFFVSLAPVTAPEDIADAIARAMDFQYRGGDRSPDALVCDYLSRRQMLLVLDNFEHLLDGVGLVSDILQAAPGVTILATSRERLHLHEEQVYPIRGLGYEDGETTGERLSVSDAAELFRQSARRVRPNFTLAAENIAQIRQICQMVEGMPLALELAAGWADTLSPAEIAAEIRKSLDFLEMDWRDVPARLRNVKATFDVSWQRLRPKQRELFPQFSVFRGGFTRQAAAAVTGASARDLSRLVSQSLLRFSRARNRFEVHELLRQYGAEKLEARPEEKAAVRDRHSAYYCQRLEKLEARLKGPGQLDAFAEIQRDIDNIQTAWNRAVKNRAIDLLHGAIFSMGRFHILCAPYHQGERIFRQAADTLSDATSADELRLLVKLQVWQNEYAREASKIKDATSLLQHSFDILERPELKDHDTRRERAFLLHRLIWIEPDLALGRQYYDQALALYRELGDQWGLAWTLADSENVFDPINVKTWQEKGLKQAQLIDDQLLVADFKLRLAITADNLGEYAEAVRLARASVAFFRGTGLQYYQAFAHGTLGLSSMLYGRLSQALAAYEVALPLCSDQGDWYYAIRMRCNMCRILRHLGRYQKAKAKAQASIVAASRVQATLTWVVSFARINLACVALAEGDECEAARSLGECIDDAREDKWINMPFALSLNSVLLQAQGKRVEAQEQALQALTTVQNGRKDIGVNVLASVALLLADRGYPAKAVEVYALVKTHPLVAVSQWFEDVYGRRISEAAAILPPELVEAAEARGRQQEMWPAAAELVEELREMGWGKGV